MTRGVRMNVSSKTVVELGTDINKPIQLAG